MQTGIYQIRNLVNNRLYIGSAASKLGLEGRWRGHRNALRKDSHGNRHLQHAWNKYGEDIFVFEILEECEPMLCIGREQHHLDTVLFASYNDKRFHQLGYNICRVAGNSLGVKRSEDTKIKLSKAHQGKRHSSETKIKMSKTQLGKRPNTKLTKSNVSEIRILLKHGITQGVIAQKFNINQCTVSDIKTGKSWQSSN
jgi:group I intron endonuclease